MKDDFLKTKRDKLQLSQQDVASEARIDRSYYTKIENGLRPSVDVAQRIANYLNFDWTLFFEQSSAINTQNNKEKEVI
ncbi:helix-turn-helix transcriptional regulator [Sporolactobacillus shoreicorticis]|uniref:Helix-turn-helix domain-containing protein n=1 Tax=Sporolactobacillus shoreicorticis TaxID=1923877 RepID=A0ABW5S740_9BACL|nr:helix-turn-helix transcriptional regulator [Sporolactobacillus shoreicorticis]MCO7127765.1 helix-turn-helix transcriptional regulator [Sporolactobacillus shoreicorticis]